MDDSNYNRTRSALIHHFRPLLDQNLYYMGAKLTSAGFGSALVNILPAVTFVTAVVLRMEKVRIRSLRGQAKVFGTACTVAGAVLMILYHGPVVQFPWSRGHHHGAAADAAENQSSASWLSGTVMVIGSCVSWAGFFILQVAHRTVVWNWLSSISIHNCVTGVLRTCSRTRCRAIRRSCR
jgi:drug/metabolite transporter (DMT)-like permease